MIFHGKCPLCGTAGKVWNRKPQVFQCPSCLTFYSNFGLVLESRRDIPEFWA